MTSTAWSRRGPETDASGASGSCTPHQRVTRSLLGYGVLAGVLYVGSAGVQSRVRTGFDLTRHDWSLLANGPGGWAQVVTFVLSGAMILAASLGLARAWAPRPGWAPPLLAGYGSALVMAGVFRADPMRGFPPGTPEGPPVHPTTAGTLHIVAGALGFLALVAAAAVVARRARARRDRVLAGLSALTSIAVLVGLAAAATGSPSRSATLTLVASVVLSWVWLAVLSVAAYRGVLTGEG